MDDGKVRRVGSHLICSDEVTFTLFPRHVFGEVKVDVELQAERISLAKRTVEISRDRNA